METKITKEDLKKYADAQQLKSYKCPVSGVLFKQNRYGLYRWKMSGLTMEKYLFIADNEDRYKKELEESRKENDK